MKDSVITHSDFIEQLKDEELQNKFLRYIYDYGCRGIEPEFTDVRDIALWSICKARIDYDQKTWSETKERKSAAGKKHKGNQYTRKNNNESSECYCEEISEGSSFTSIDNNNTSDDSECASKNVLDAISEIDDTDNSDEENYGTEIENIGTDKKNGTDKKVGTDGSVYVYVSDNVSDSVNDNVNVKNVYESESVSVSVPKNKQKAPSPTRFIKPNYDEVRDYCAQNGYTISPERFVDYYESKGWKVGATPMKNWKAAVRTWEAKQKDFEKPSSANASGGGWPSDRLEL